jgi:TonB family protein
LLATGGWAAEAGNSTRPTLLPGMFINGDDYPDPERMAERKGTTRFDLAVDAGGTPIGCTIIKTSGSRVLDEKACALWRKRAKFAPARDAQGQAIPGVYRGDSVWMLSGTDADITPSPPSGYSVKVSFDREGNVERCKVEALYGNALTEDQRSKCQSIGDRRHFEAFMGQPGQGFESALFRFYRTGAGGAGRPKRGFALERTLVEVSFDQTRDGGISWCDVVVPPVTPLLGMSKEELCSSNGFGINRAGGNDLPYIFALEVVATARR